MILLRCRSPSTTSRWVEVLNERQHQEVTPYFTCRTSRTTSTALPFAEQQALGKLLQLLASLPLGDPLFHQPHAPPALS